MKELQISGVSSTRKEYSDKLSKTILSRIPDIRNKFAVKYQNEVDDNNQLFRGLRYKNDMRVIDVLESNVEEENFDMSLLDDYIFSALKDLANADYYYCFEKDYGVEETETDEPDDEEY